VAERLAEVVITVGFLEEERVMVSPAMVVTETAGSLKFPHTAELAPAGSNCLRTW
jgi:hypothetical protein